MTFLRVLIIVGIVGLLGLIAVLLLSDSADVVSTEPSESPGPGTTDGGQVVTPLPSREESTVDTPFRMEPTPVGYEVSELPTSGLVSGIVSSEPSAGFLNVMDEVFIDLFWLLECRASNGETGRALILTAQPDPNTGRILGAEAAIRAWEPDIVRDLALTLYPEIREGEVSEVTSIFSAASIDSRATTFEVGGEEYEIHYGWVLNFPVFATSGACLTAAINDTYAPHAH